MMNTFIIFILPYCIILRLAVAQKLDDKLSNSDHFKRNVEYASPDLTIIVEDNYEFSNISAFKMSSNNSQLGWVSLGKPALIKTISPDNEFEMRLFHFTEDGLFMNIDFLTTHHKKLLIKAANKKYNKNDTQEDQFLQLPLSSCKCQINLPGGESFEGNSKNMTVYPLIINFAVSSSALKPLLKQLKSQSEFNITCSIKSVDTYLKKELAKLNAEPVYKNLAKYVHDEVHSFRIRERDMKIDTINALENKLMSKWRKMMDDHEREMKGQMKNMESDIYCSQRSLNKTFTSFGKMGSHLVQSVYKCIKNQKSTKSTPLPELAGKCPLNYVNISGHCIWNTTQNGSYCDAQKLCHQNAGEVIFGDALSAYIKHSTKNQSSIWVGLTDMLEERGRSKFGWKWNNGSLLENDSLWYGQFPHGSSDCVDYDFYLPGLSDFFNCSESLLIVCQGRNPSALHQKQWNEDKDFILEKRKPVDAWNDPGHCSHDIGKVLNEDICINECLNNASCVSSYYHIYQKQCTQVLYTDAIITLPDNKTDGWMKLTMNY